jgi:hypothetical protein
MVQRKEMVRFSDPLRLERPAYTPEMVYIAMR